MAMIRRAGSPAAGSGGRAQPRFPAPAGGVGASLSMAEPGPAVRRERLNPENFRVEAPAPPMAPGLEMPPPPGRPTSSDASSEGLPPGGRSASAAESVPG